MTERKSKTVTEALDDFVEGISVAGKLYTYEQYAEIRKIARKHDVKLTDAAMMYGWWHPEEVPS
jgi:hypothetical protein